MSDEDPRPTDHVDDLEDGAGCTEIWAHLSERRSESSRCGPGADD